MPVVVRTDGGQQREEWKKEGRIGGRFASGGNAEALITPTPDYDDDDGFLPEEAKQRCGENVTKRPRSGFRTVQGGKHASR